MDAERCEQDLIALVEQLVVEGLVEVRDATGALVQFANADTDGNFRVPLPPGSYQVAIEAQGGVWPSCLKRVTTCPR